MTSNNATEHQKVHEFLKKRPMGVLSTVSEDGKPWGSAIYYVADVDFNFYFVTRTETFKYQNIDKHPFAALTIADNDSQTTVQASGEISKIPPEDYMDIVFNKLDKAQHPKNDINWVPPLMKVHKGDYMPLCLKPSRLQFADYKEFKSDIHTDYIEKIIGE